MKKSLFLYLFIFAVLFNIFTYMYFTSQQKHDTGRIESMQETLKTTRDSLQALQSRIQKADYFSLENNYEAQDYFAGQDIEALQIKIRDGIYAKNKGAEGNPLVQYPPMNGRPFMINNMKVLNNRWIIADYTNGVAMGEVLIKYFVEDNGEITYETITTNLHASTVN